MPGTLDRRLRSPASRLSALAAVVVLSWSVLAAHGPIAGGHMGSAMGKAMTICLAVLQGAIIVYASRRIRRARTRKSPVRFARVVLTPVSRLLVKPTVASARAGPERLQVFRL